VVSTCLLTGAAGDGSRIISSRSFLGGLSRGSRWFSHTRGQPDIYEMETLAYQLLYSFT
jgi:hypothetical protein